MKAETVIGAFLVLIGVSLIVASLATFYVVGGWLLVALALATVTALMWWISRQIRNY